MKMRVCVKNFIYYDNAYNSMSMNTHQHTQQNKTEQEEIKVSKYRKNNRAYKQISIDIDILSKIDRISKEENISFSDVLNFLLMDALGMNDTNDDQVTVADEPQSQHHEE